MSMSSLSKSSRRILDPERRGRPTDHQRLARAGLKYDKYTRTIIKVGT